MSPPLSRQVETPTAVAAIEDLLADDGLALRAISATVAHGLNLPVPVSVALNVYPDRKSFERGLVDDGGVSPAGAAQLGEFAAGIGRRRHVLLQEPELPGRKDREWLRLMAHELTHVCQIELALGEGRADQWLAEGMAEWVAASVIERLGLDSMSRRRELALARLRNHAALIATPIDLEALGSPRGFTLSHLRFGTVPTYQLVFLMTDYLIAQRGMPSLVQYFASFSRSTDRCANFASAFAVSLDQFASDVRGHLQAAAKGL
jgi:hypothetical protein